MALYIGLMSGTSLDGVDAVLAEWPDAPMPDGAETGRPVERGFVHLPMPPETGAELLALNSPGGDELHRSALAANALARLYAEAVHRLLSGAGVAAERIRALGAHGQTVRHRPGEFDGTGYTVQLLNGALLAELTGIDVVCDLRSRDVAAGGQGAPLVPAFHAACFGRQGEPLAVLNIGGIANITWLPGDGSVLGFDCGPGNVLLDLWCRRHLGTRHDAGGAWSAQGDVDPDLLDSMLADAYFALPPPKSTGRDRFNAGWLDERLGRSSGEGARTPVDVMATLAELTAKSVASSLERLGARPRELLVCGGGAFNVELLRRLATCTAAHVRTTAGLGVAPDRVEALAFAWLARAHDEKRPGNVPAVTGATGPRRLGARHPAR